MTVFDKILNLLKDTGISEIMINSPSEIFYEKDGRVKQADFKFESAEQVIEFIKKVSVPSGGQTWDSPIVSARMTDGSRVHVVFSPVVLGGGPSISIRKFLPSRLSLKSLVQSQTLSDEMAYFLNACVEARINIVVCGGTSSGKTSFLNALSTCIDPNDRIVTIEDMAELKIRAKNIVRLECQVADHDGQAVTIRRLLHSSLRMRPDRIIVGETRGEEAFDMLQAMNTGHDGSMTTIHANSSRDCLSRIESMSLLANTGLPLEALRRQISSALDLIVHMHKLRDGNRRVVSISEVCGMEGSTILSQEIFHYVPMGEAADKSLLGRFAATGIVPHCMSRFKELGIGFPKDFFSGDYNVDMDLGETVQLPVKLKVRKK